jgi:type IV secretory pathway VirB10-like protein
MLSGNPDTQGSYSNLQAQTLRKILKIPASISIDQSDNIVAVAVASSQLLVIVLY